MSDFIVLNLNKLKDDLGQNDTAPDTPLVSVYKNAHGDIVVGNTTVSLSDLPAIQGTPGYHVNGRKTPMSAPLFTMTAQQIRALPDVNNNLLNIRARFLQNQRKKK